MLLQASGIQKYFGAELCLADISFSVNEQDRIGIIGQNGAGKTTLLKLITGEYEPDAGELSFARGVRVGYLEQNAALHPQRTVYQEMQDAFAPVLAAMQELQQVQAQMAQRAAPALAQRHSELQAVIDAADGFPAGGMGKAGGRAFRRRAHAPAPCKTAFAKPGYPYFGRAYEPSGLCHHGMAGGVSENLFRRGAGGQP